MKYFKHSEHVHVFEFDPNEGSLVAHGEDKLTRVEDINHDWYESRSYWHKIASINCSFFNTDGSRNGCSMENSMWRVTPYPNNSWVNVVWEWNKLKVTTSIDLNDYLSSRIVKGVLPLMASGVIDKRVKQVAEVAPRTFIGQKEDGTVVMCVTDGRPFGLSFENTFKLAKELGCYTAVMLDGGGSSTMVINGNMVNNNENRKVYDALIFYSKEKLKMQKHVVLDAGHGMLTSGKQTPYFKDGTVIKEAEQNYPIMFKVAEELRSHDVIVTLTNDNINFDMSLNSRVTVANATNADLFYSFHKNATAEYIWNGTRGTEHLIYGKGGEAEKAANIIHNKVIEMCGEKDRGVKVQNVQVLRETKMPAVLGELGFMTNMEDAMDMIDEQAQECYAKAIAYGILEYLGIEVVEEVKEKECVDVALKDNIITTYERIEADLRQLKLLIDTL